MLLPRMFMWPSCRPQTHHSWTALATLLVCLMPTKSALAKRWDIWGWETKKILALLIFCRSKEKLHKLNFVAKSRLFGTPCFDPKSPWKGLCWWSQCLHYFQGWGRKVFDWGLPTFMLKKFMCFFESIDVMPYLGPGCWFWDGGSRRDLWPSKYPLLCYKKLWTCLGSS